MITYVSVSVRAYEAECKANKMGQRMQGECIRVNYDLAFLKLLRRRCTIQSAQNYLRACKDPNTTPTNLRSLVGANASAATEWLRTCRTLDFVLCPLINQL